MLPTSESSSEGGSPILTPTTTTTPYAASVANPTSSDEDGQPPLTPTTNRSGYSTRNAESADRPSSTGQRDPVDTLQRLRECLRVWRESMSNFKAFSDAKEGEVAESCRELAHVLWSNAVEHNSTLPVSMRHPVLTEFGAEILLSDWRYAPLRPGEQPSERGLGYYRDWELQHELLTQAKRYDWLTGDGWHSARYQSPVDAMLEEHAALAKSYQECVEKDEVPSTRGSTHMNGIVSKDFTQLIREERQALREVIEPAMTAFGSRSRALWSGEAQEVLRDINAWGDALGLDWEITGPIAKRLAQLSKPLDPIKPIPPPTSALRSAGSARGSRRHTGPKRVFSADELFLGRFVLDYKSGNDVLRWSKEWNLLQRE